MEKITKEMNGGVCVYQDEKGEPVHTYKEDVDWIVRVTLEPLRDFLDMIGEDDESQKAMFIAKALLERAEEKIYEATEYLQKNFGMVEMIKASYLQHSVKPETILDVVFTPCKEVTA
jgi:hypothetical protein